MGGSIMWKWIWPRVGATPISQGLDSEMFDRADYPYSDTFVREAIQNSLDARHDLTLPVTISFTFHQKDLGEQRVFLAEAIDLRNQAGLAVPEEWARGEVSWIAIEDFNARGLDGDLGSRISNFWNYWLNFGQSNKDGAGRGGRGIGRVTFLIASRVHSVVGFTRRVQDGRTVACGMTVLRAMQTPKGFRSTHAYLAAEEDDEASIYRLHDSTEFHDSLVSAFGLTGYRDASAQSGLALIIPYPHQELTREGILASSIEHFAPAIISGTLVVRTNDTVLDASTIDEIAEGVVSEFRVEAIQKDVARYLELIREALRAEPIAISISDVNSGLQGLRNEQWAIVLQNAVREGKAVCLEIGFPLQKGAKTHDVSLKAIVRKTPENSRPIDRFYREGMSLPDVRAKTPGELDVILLVEELELATYLNCCEGKAHLDLLESKEIRTKLEDRGYRQPFKVKRLVKGLQAELRNFLTPDITEPDENVFDTFFAIADPDPGKKSGKVKKPDKPPEPPPPPPPPRIPPFALETVGDGFRFKANPAYTEWPVNVSITMAYADGSRSPAWSEFDFRSSDLTTVASNCEYQYIKNKLRAVNCGPNSVIEVSGFDIKRELDARIKVWKNAQDD
ncbi:hypothetical protein X765_27595 [Mesorhizobium sp. LSHC440B00]|nr:hypothetical protein X765_27595 [Mesorhizobium sp. LSHC440B00]ESX31166.1 hypothetical protein X763_27925 [Mesorhizobium sp. LSHC432A00]ESX68455.1 hypothetical protein X757_28720 [Mesorhizobium sp. LSHC414A00]